MIDVKQGMTFSGWSPYLGFFVLFVGIILLVFGINEGDFIGVVGLFLAFMGVVIFMNLQGTLIDPAKRRCRMYRSFVLFRTGAWLDLAHFDRITVSKHREQYTHWIGASIGTQAHIRAYFLSLKGEKMAVHLNEYEDRKSALAMAERISAAVGLPVDDQAKPIAVRPDRRR